MNVLNNIGVKLSLKPTISNGIRIIRVIILKITMENLLARLESLPSYKEMLKEWCKTNGIKVSFLIAITLSRARSIYKKLMLTYSRTLFRYSKGYGKTNTRWL